MSTTTDTIKVPTFENIVTDHGNVLLSSSVARQTVTICASFGTDMVTVTVPGHLFAKFDREALDGRQ